MDECGLCVVVTTYARPDGLSRLIDDLVRELPAEGVEVRIYDDHSPYADAALGRRIARLGWRWLRAETNHGRRNWWQWWNVILEDLKSSPARHFIVLQDDMRLCSHFFDRALGLWSAIDDSRKASLYLLIAEGRSELGTSCWTPVRSEVAGPALLTGWVDMNAFLCDRGLFNELQWKLHPIPARRWNGRDEIGSGVGQQISRRAYDLGLNMYSVQRSLTVHDDSPSLMNPAARVKQAMRTVSFVDGDEEAARLACARPKVFASLASIPTREAGLQRVVESLAQQVDELGVYLNGYLRVPSFLGRLGVEVVESGKRGDVGDAGKFHWAGTRTGYQLVCDDDILYPADYVAKLLEGLERHGPGIVAGFHGSLLKEPVDDYHRSRRLLHFTRALASDTGVHVLGTGVAGYHSSAIRVSPEDFPERNLADIWFALLGQRQQVPFVCLRREEGWLREIPGYRQDSIYAAARRNPGPSRETRAIQSHSPWAVYRPRPDPAAEPAPVSVRNRRPAPSPLKPATSPKLVRVRASGPTRTVTLVLPDRDHITSAVQRSGTYYERDLLDAIRSRRTGGTFVDVGAHYGNHTAFFALECGARRVLAIEPNPPAFTGLLETVSANSLEPVVSARRIAVHSSWRNVKVVQLPWRPRPGSGDGTNSGRVSIVRATGGGSPAAPLDEILVEVQELGVLKVDAEGLSADIMASGRRVIARYRPLIAAEAATPEERNALRMVLGPLGYREGERYCWTPTWLWEPVEAI
jgi:FkbM family methyltransferase